MGLTAEAHRRAFPRRALVLILVVIVLLALAAWLVSLLPGFNPALSRDCMNKPVPNPLIPVPNIIIGCALSFLAGRAVAYLRERRRRR